MTMTSFTITFCGQCCRRHFVGQQVVSDISVVRNTAQNSSNNLSSYPPDNHHSSDVV